MSTVAVTCAHCRKSAAKDVGAVNRAHRRGLLLFCSRQCFGLHRRVNRPVAERRKLKSEYDARRRAVLYDEIAAKKREYFRRTYDPAKARAYRKQRVFNHTAYCRRYYSDPVRKQEKVEYDIRRRGEAYADFAESWRLLIELEKEIRQRMPDKYERQKARGYFDKINERRRYDRQDRRTA